MIRRAFRMRVHPGAEAEYARRHQPIWPELEAVLLAHGVSTYSIFYAPDTGDLFAYVEFENEDRWNAVSDTEVCRRWWGHMCPLMPVNPDNSPRTQDLPEVFHIHQPAASSTTGR